MKHRIATTRAVFASLTLLCVSMMVSAQAQAFDAGGLSYIVTRVEYCRSNGSRVWKYRYGRSSFLPVLRMG